MKTPCHAWVTGTDCNQENIAMDLEKLVMVVLFCAAGMVAFSVGSELRKRKIDKENREREKREKAEKKARKKR